MKGLKAVAKATQNVDVRDKSTWVSLYYDYKTQTLCVKPGENRYFITQLINPCTEQDVLETYYKCNP